MIDLGLLFTGAAAVAAFAFGRGTWLRHILLIAWLTVVLQALVDVRAAFVVFTMAMLDLTIAGTALIRYTQDRTRQDARIVGGLSMALMPAHFVMSATAGRVDWGLYASVCNLVFVLQCLIVGGWLDGVGRCINRVVSRVLPSGVLRRGGR